MRSIRSNRSFRAAFATLLVAALLPLTSCKKDEAEEAAATDAAPEAPEQAGPPLDTTTLPEVVAKVNGEEITKQTLLEQAAARRQQMIQGRAPQVSEDAVFYRGVLDDIVRGILLFDEAGAKGFQATEDEVEQQIGAIRAGFPDEAALVAALETQGTTTEQLTESIRKELSIRRFVSEAVVSEIQITDEDKKAYYDANLERMQHPEQVRVRHILIGVPEDAAAEARAEALTKANDLKQQIDSGADFAALAKEHSGDTTSAELGGEIPWIGPSQTVPPFEQAAYALAKGEVSAPVETRFGYHIIELLDRKAAGVLEFTQVEPRIGQVLQQEQIRVRLDDLVNQLKSQASIEIFM